jgi:UDP-glucose:(heptosyl)LPS alpha-1,3-glucosyltransferase
MEQRYYGGRKYRKLIALSDQVKDDLMRFYGVPDKDVVVIPNGFAPSEFSVARRNEQREAMRQKLGYANSDKVVIFAANELERKGFGPLLRAIAALDDSSVRLLAVGRLNPLAYASEIQRLGMTQRVKFTGPTSDVASYYAAADVFALPTQYEAWGLVIVEAMACGLPALTSRLAGASIAIDEGQTGYLLDNPADVGEIGAKLSLLLQGEHAAPEVISDSVAQYAWSRVLETYEKVLTECART